MEKFINCIELKGVRTMDDAGGHRRINFGENNKKFRCIDKYLIYIKRIVINTSEKINSS